MKSKMKMNKKNKKKEARTAVDARFGQLIIAFDGEKFIKNLGIQ